MPINSKTFLHVIGVTHGKHDTIKCPLKSGSEYYNNKVFFSIVLLPICDAHYTFTPVDNGEYGSNNDTGIFSSAEMRKLFHSEKMNFPDAKSLCSGTNNTLPLFRVGDEAFPLKPWLQRPYPGKRIPEEKVIFNYRLSPV